MFQIDKLLLRHGLLHVFQYQLQVTPSSVVGCYTLHSAHTTVLCNYITSQVNGSQNQYISTYTIHKK